MKNILIALLMTSLTACSTMSVGTNKAFTGKSLASNTLRNDVMTQIKMLEKTAYQCTSINSVDTKIVETTTVNGMADVQELWTVNACKKTHTYPIHFRQSPTGGTDFNVTFNKQ